MCLCNLLTSATKSRLLYSFYGYSWFARSTLALLTASAWHTDKPIDRMGNYCEIYGYLSGARRRGGNPKLSVCPDEQPYWNTPPRLFSRSNFITILSCFASADKLAGGG